MSGLLYRKPCEKIMDILIYIFVTEKPDFCFLYIFSGWCMLSKMHPSRYTQHISRQDKVEKCICLAVYLISNKLLSKL